MWPVLPVPFAESVLDLDPFVLLLPFPKKSKVGLLATLSRSVGLKRPDKLDMSPPPICVGVCVRPAFDPFMPKDCID